MLKIDKSNVVSYSNATVKLDTSGWVIVAKHDARGTHDCPFKVTSVTVQFGLDDNDVKYYPSRVSFEGQWASKDGKRWLEGNSYFGWANSKLQQFEFLPQELQLEFYRQIVTLMETKTAEMLKSISSMKVNRKFISNAYQAPAEETKTSDGEEPLPFLATVKQTQPSPIIGNDVSKWKIATLEVGLEWKRSRRSSKAKNSSKA